MNDIEKAIVEDLLDVLHKSTCLMCGSLSGSNVDCVLCVAADSVRQLIED